MKFNDYPVCRKDNIVVQEFTDEVLIYDLQTSKALCLNQTSAMIWMECDGTKNVTQIANNLSKTLKTFVSDDIVWLALEQLKNDGLLVETYDFKTPFDGLSRREVIRKIGFASMVALPVISAIVAPTAVNAQSSVCSCTSTNPNSRPPGCICNANSQCCNNVCGGGGTTCAVSTGVIVGPGCCPTVVCPPANGTNLPGGCGCVGNANCASATCINGICRS